MRVSLKAWKNFLLIMVMLASIFPAAVLAQSAPGEGLEIAPPLKELNVNPGQTVTFQIKLRNVTTGSVVANANVEDFVAQGEQGQPKLLIGDTTEKSPYSIKDWVQPVADMTLAPRESKTADITLIVPKNASPGGHYGVIRFSAVPTGTENANVSLSASIGTLVLANVSGNVVKKASLIDFYTSKNNKKQNFFQSGPISFTERINNLGNVHVKPVGTVRITNMFGSEVAVLSINEKAGNILPKSIRRFDQQFNKSGLFGPYKAEANVQYDGQNLNSNLSFWVLPLKEIAIILIALIIIIQLLRVGIKRYNRHIIKKANKH